MKLTLLQVCTRNEMRNPVYHVNVPNVRHIFTEQPLVYREVIECNKHKKKLQIYIQELMAAHIIVDNGYRKIE